MFPCTVLSMNKHQYSDPKLNLVRKKKSNFIIVNVDFYNISHLLFKKQTQRNTK